MKALNILLNLNNKQELEIKLNKLRQKNIPIDTFFEMARSKLSKEKEFDLKIDLYTFSIIRESNFVFLNITKDDMNTEKLITLGEMTSSVFHELNTPLNISLNSIELLKMDLEDDNIDEVKKYVDNIEQSISKLVQISDGMHSFCRNDQNQEQVVDMKIIVNQVLSFYSGFIQKNGIKITFDPYISGDFKFKGKNALINQVLVNLLKNAKDAIEELPVFSKWIEIQLIDLKSHIKIRVIDGGNGIPKEIQSKIFEHFYTTKDVGKGTGIGLSFCKKIVENHTGKISIDNECKNTCFEILIPKRI